MTNIPTNRIVAFAGPYIAIVSGVIADWLVVHLHVLAIFHTTSTAIASTISQGLVFGLTAVLVWAGHHKWLTGHQLLETAKVTTPPTAVAIAEPAPAETPAQTPTS